MSVQSFSTGKPVYGSGSFAPTRGQVSAAGAQGYMQRELKKQGQGPFGGVSKVGADGKSDTRSGVAAKAVGAQRPMAPASPPNPTGGPKTPDNGGSNGPNTGGPKVPDNGGSTPNNPGNTGGGSGTPAPAPPPPQVVTDSSGQLQLPYDQQFSQDVLAALDQYNSQLLEMQMQSQQENLNYVKGRRDTDIKYDDTKRATLSGNAARGTAFSSGYGVAVGKNARDYQNSINDQDAQHNLFNQMNTLKRGSIETAYQRMLSQAALDYGNRLDDSAGDLGYGQDGGSNETPVPGGSITPVDQHKYWPTTPKGPRTR